MVTFKDQNYKLLHQKFETNMEEWKAVMHKPKEPKDSISLQTILNMLVTIMKFPLCSFEFCLDCSII